jgi:hypothetical protein
VASAPDAFIVHVPGQVITGVPATGTPQAAVQTAEQGRDYVRVIAEIDFFWGFRDSSCRRRRGRRV